MHRPPTATLFHGVTVSKRDGDVFNRVLAHAGPGFDVASPLAEMLDSITRRPEYELVQLVDLGDYTDHVGLTVVGFVSDAVDQTVNLGPQVYNPTDEELRQLLAIVGVLFPGGHAMPSWHLVAGCP